MTAKIKYQPTLNAPNVHLFAVSFAPNGTSAPTDVVCAGGGSVTVAYVSTGKWTLTLNDQWAKFYGTWCSFEKASIGTANVEVSVDSKSASGKTVTVVVQVAADHTADMAVSNTAVDRVNVLALVAKSDVPGDGV